MQLTGSVTYHAWLTECHVNRLLRSFQITESDEISYPANVRTPSGQYRHKMHTSSSFTSRTHCRARFSNLCVAFCVYDQAGVLLNQQNNKPIDFVAENIRLFSQTKISKISTFYYCFSFFHRPSVDPSYTN